MSPDYQCWLVKLIGYDFEIQYKLGTENRDTDALSQLAEEMHLTVLSIPTVLDWSIIKEELGQNEKLKQLYLELADGSTNHEHWSF